MDVIHNAHRIAIVRATPADLPDIIDIWQEGVQSGFGLPPPPPAVAECFFLSRLQNQSDIFGLWIARCDNKALGWHAMQPCRNTPIDAHLVAEVSVYVSYVDRGTGVGSALLLDAMDRARKNHLIQLRGNIAVANTASALMCDKLGWVRVGELPKSKASDPSYFFYAYGVPAS